VHVVTEDTVSLGEGFVICLEYSSVSDSRFEFQKWFWDNPNCERIIFTERLAWAVPYSRRTNHVLTTLMLAMNAKEATRVCPTIGIRISHDTLLKILRRIPVPLEQPDIIGIDDFAFKKGHRYGTIICNAQTHRPIELIRSRNHEELIGWID